MFKGVNTVKIRTYLTAEMTPRTQLRMANSYAAVKTNASMPALKNDRVCTLS